MVSEEEKREREAKGRREYTREKKEIIECSNSMRGKRKEGWRRIISKKRNRMMVMVRLRRL